MKRWFKKDVHLSWNQQHLSLAVAQELFSSHQVDAGSLLLLRSIEPDQLPQSGTAVDFGCGYGVLGLAWKAANPDWRVTLIDRDALAVEFSAWNARALELQVETLGGLDLHHVQEAPNLVLWNVPGKAGADVIARLAHHVIESMAELALLALVVVHPLKGTLLDVFRTRADAELEHESAGSDHTVLHVRKSASGTLSTSDTFADGVFDREPVTADTGLISYEFLPVVGLPQFDGPDFETVLHSDAIESVSPALAHRVACVGVGQGHLPMYLRLRYPQAELVLVDRDLLALKASERLVKEPVHTRFAATDFDTITGPFDLVCISIPDQTRPPVLEYLLTWALSNLQAGNHISVGGGSTEVSRFLNLARKESRLRLRNRDRRRGSSGAILEVRT